MFPFLVFAGLCVSCLANLSSKHESVTEASASDNGSPFTTTGNGRIQGIRLWESPDGFITGMQLRHQNMWGNVIGVSNGRTNELVLHKNEAIVQISGKHDDNYIHQLIFRTTSKRSLIVGQPFQKSFNMYGIPKGSELSKLTGSVDADGITIIKAAWAVDNTRDVMLALNIDE